MLAQRLEELREEGREEGRREGYGEGTLKEKQTVLLRQISKKFSLTEEEKVKIIACEDLTKLDEALDVILFAEHKQEVVKKVE